MSETIIEIQKKVSGLLGINSEAEGGEEKRGGQHHLVRMVGESKIEDTTPLATKVNSLKVVKGWSPHNGFTVRRIRLLSLVLSCSELQKPCYL